MRLSEETLKSLHALIEKDPSLQAQLQQTDNAPQAARILAQAASAANLDLAEDAIRTHLESTIQQAATQALSDAQLEKVAGGRHVADFGAGSVFTFGIGCAAVNIR
jgi:hypothetical protein